MCSEKLKLWSLPEVGKETSVIQHDTGMGGAYHSLAQRRRRRRWISVRPHNRVQSLPHPLDFKPLVTVSAPHTSTRDMQHMRRIISARRRTTRPLLLVQQAQSFAPPPKSEWHHSQPLPPTCNTLYDALYRNYTSILWRFLPHYKSAFRAM